MANSPYSAKPSTLNNPVPGAEAASSADAFLSSFDAPTVATPPAQATASAAPTADSFLSSFDAPTAAPQGFALDPNSPDAQNVANSVGANENPDPSFIQQNMHMLSNFVDRFKTGLAANDTEKVGYLKQKYGEGNVKVNSNGAIMFRRDPKAKFDKLDPATLDVFNDLLSDNARNFIMEGVALPAELVGGAAGFGIGGFPGAAVGARGGRLVAATVANKLADKVAEFAGVPHDPTRSGLGEAMLNTAGEAIAPVIGAKLLKRLPGTFAYNEAKQAGEKEVVALSRQSEEVAQAALRLKESGDLVPINGEQIGVPGANVVLMGHQLNPDNPQLGALANQAAQNAKFINATRDQAEDWAKSLEGNLLEIARKGNKGPVAPEALASTVTNAVSNVERAEGQAIGKYVAKAAASVGKKRQALDPEVEQQSADLLKQFGFTMRQKSERVLENGEYVDKLSIGYVPPTDVRPLVGQMGLNTQGEIRAVVNKLGEMAKAKERGGVRLDELDRLRNSLGELGSSLRGTPAGAKISQLTGKLRQQYRSVVESGLTDETERAAFNASMDEFGVIRENVDTLKRVLNDDASAKTIVGNIFTGKENLPRIRAIKSLTADTPEVFSALKEEWVNQQLIKFADRNTPFRYNATGMLNALEKQYGPEFMNEVIGQDKQKIRDLLLVGERLRNTFKDAKVDQLDEKAKQGVMNTVIGLVGDVKFKTMNGVAALVGSAKDRDYPLMQIMTQDGIDKYVANYPGRIDKKRVSQNLKDILGQYKIMRALGSGAASGAKLAEQYDAVGSSIRTKVRNFTKQKAQPTPDEEQQ